MKKIIALLVALLVIVCSLSILSYADFGDFAGDADYGGGYDDNDYGGGYSYDDDDDDDDDDYYYGSSSHSGNSGEDDVEFLDMLIGVGVIVGIVVLIYFLPSKKKHRNNLPKAQQPAGAAPTNISTLLPIDNYRELDGYFSQEKLKEKITNLYYQQQQCWTARDIEPLRPYFTDALFTRFEMGVKSHKTNHRINYVDRVAVLDVELLGYKQEAGEDIIVARLKTRIVDYTVDENTGALLSGSKTDEKFMTYEWDLSRTTGQKSVQDADVTKIVCPSCGAPLDINASARCEYCDSVVNMNTHSWVISAIRGISQSTK